MLNNNNIITSLFKNKKSFIGTSIIFIAFYWVYNNYIKQVDNKDKNKQDEKSINNIDSCKDNNNNNSSNNNNNNNNNTNDNSNNIVKKVKFNNFFKLSNDIKIHVLSTPEECDLILNQFYQSLLMKMNGDNNSSNTNSMEDGADIINQQQQQSTTEITKAITSDESNALLFPNCNENNNDGLDFIIGFDAEWSNFNSIDENVDSTITTTTTSSTTTSTTTATTTIKSLQYNHKVALIQLSSKNETFLIQVSQMEKIPASLEQILTDPRLIKVGVAVSQDAATIFQTFSVVTKGCVDLVPIARLTNYEGNGLASLALNVMNITLDKSNLIRCSHWENKLLSKDQIHYAAADAWVGREIFEIMYNTYKNSKINPNEKDLIYTLCRPFINTSFKVKVEKSKNSNNKSNSNPNKPLKENMLKKSVPDKRVLYDNCLMYSPDDVLLCSISKKKVEWYVSRQLAVIIKEEPLSIKLKFQPHGEGHSGDDYYLAHKENICVVCGSTHKILRHSVVPHCYRQYLPEEIKSHSSHDVLLLCCDCHANMDKRTQIMRMMIAKQYNVPLDSENKVYITDNTLLKITKMALIVKNHFYQQEQEQEQEQEREQEQEQEREQEQEQEQQTETTNEDGTTTTIIVNKISNKKYKSNIPEYKLEEMKIEVSNYIGKEEMNLNDLNQLIYLNPKQKNENYIPHEKQVMEKVLALGEKGIFEFIRSWRKNFIETVQPKFLSQHWSINKDILNNYKPKNQKPKQIQL
ncbi:hypothetical protein ACTA71_005866 [Dictyostelium dimigraforme]